MPDWHAFRMLPPSTHGPSAAAVFCYLESTGSVGYEDFVLRAEAAGAGRVRPARPRRRPPRPSAYTRPHASHDT